MSLVATRHLKKPPAISILQPKTARTEVKKIIGGKCLVTFWQVELLKNSKFKNLELKNKLNSVRLSTDHTSLAHPPQILGPTTMMVNC